MTQSDQIEKIAEALSKAQSTMVGAIKDSKNPYFNSSYADLASVWEAVRVPLTSNGLAVVQTIEDEGESMVLVTKLIHNSGQWFSSKTKLILGSKKDMQALGSAITYARRYGLAAISGVPQVDDDGNLCSTHKQEKVTERVSVMTEKLRELVKKILSENKDNKEEKLKEICTVLGINDLAEVATKSDSEKAKMLALLCSLDKPID